MHGLRNLISLTPSRRSQGRTPIDPRTPAAVRSAVELAIGNVAEQSRDEPPR